MTTDITTPDRPQLTAMTTADLRKELSQAIGLTARAIAHVAVIWNELTRRGEDLTGYKFALADYMGRVANGQLLPEAVAQLAGRVRTLSLVAELPVAEQRRLIEGAPVEIVTDDGIVEKALADLSWTEAARVIRNGHVVTPKEQEIALSRMRASKRRPRTGRPFKIAIDDDRGMLRIGRAEAPVERVIAALRAAKLI